MAIYNAVWDAPKFRGGKRRGVGICIYDGAVLNAGSGQFVAPQPSPFKTVLAVDVTAQEATIDNAGLGTAAFTWTVSAAGVVTVFGWKPTSVGNPTLIATTFATPISVVVYGLY